jgi:hypothetical protein
MCLHLGQRKLLLTEVKFLTLYGQLASSVVYIGAAPGQHLPFLATLFKTHTFYLFDPREFAFEETSNLKQFRLLFSPSEISFLDNFLFISDIRQEIKSSFSKERVDQIVEKDMELQKDWVKKLKPTASLLKFRLPRSKPFYSYLKGELWEQPWAPPDTLETRLMISKVPEEIDYGLETYLEKIKFQKRNRESLIENHKVPLKRVPGLDYCWDCNLEIQIWKLYLERRGEITNSEICKKMLQAGHQTQKYLTVRPHGKKR